MTPQCTALFHRRGCEGAVYVEFLLAFPPVFVLFLAIFQFALLFAAQFVVQHAAVAAARSAIVVLEDDPRYYRGAPRGDISSEEPDSRMGTIRRAAHARLATLARNPLLDVTTAVTLPAVPGSKELLRDHVPPGAQLTARVTHIVPCVVPIAAQLLCRRFGDRTRLSAARKLALHELERAPQHGLQRLLLLKRVALLQAEATLPAQTARYPYASELNPQGAAQQRSPRRRRGRT